MGSICSSRTRVGLDEPEKDGVKTDVHIGNDTADRPTTREQLHTRPLRKVVSVTAATSPTGQGGRKSPSKAANMQPHIQETPKAETAETSEPGDEVVASGPPGMDGLFAKAANSPPQKVIIKTGELPPPAAPCALKPTPSLSKRRDSWEEVEAESALERSLRKAEKRNRKLDDNCLTARTMRRWSVTEIPETKSTRNNFVGRLVKGSKAVARRLSVSGMMPTADMKKMKKPLKRFSSAAV